MQIDVCKVFAATKARDRDALGERVTKWLRENPEIDVVDKIVTQSSDKEFHCLSITIFGREAKNGGGEPRRKMRRAR